MSNHIEHVINYMDQPEYLFVFPTVRKKDGKACGEDTIEKLLSRVKNATRDNSSFVAWILSPMSPKQIKAEHRHAYTESFVQLVEMMKPRKLVTFGYHLYNELQGGNWTDFRKDHGTYFRLNDNTYHIPVFGKEEPFAHGKYGGAMLESLLHDLEHRLSFEPEEIEPPLYELVTGDPMKSLDEHVKDYNGNLYLDIETTSLEKEDGKIVMVGVMFDHHDICLIYPTPEPAWIDKLFDLAVSQGNPVCVHSADFDLPYMMYHSDKYKSTVPDFRILYDTLLFANVIGEQLKSLKHLSNKFLNRLGNNAFKAEEGYFTLAYLAEDVLTTRELFYKLHPMVSDFMIEWNSEIQKLAIQIHFNGLHFDKNLVERAREHDAKAEEEITQQIRDMADKPDLNPASRADLTMAMLNMGIELEKTTAKGSYSTSKDALSDIDHPFARLIEDYRSISKDLNTYYGSIPNKFAVGNKIHGSIKVAGTVSGRLSSEKPNLQNITNKSNFKEIFISRFENGVIGLTDFSQAELRTAAYISGDEQFGTLLSEEDAHLAIARLVFNDPTLDKNTPDGKKKRGISKQITFGVLYGGTAWGLYRRLVAEGQDVEQEYIENIVESFYTRFPKLSKWMRETRYTATKTKRGSSPLGRIYRYDYSLIGRDMTNSIKRTSVNYPIQGTSADLLGRVAYIAWQEIKRQQLEALIINTVHDSIINDMPQEEVQKVYNCLQMGFESLQEIPWFKNNPLYNILPFTGDLVIGNSWLDVEEKRPHAKPIASYPLTSHTV